MNGLPGLRLLPDAPVPDGRTVLTSPDATSIEAVMGHRRHLGLFIPVTNAIEALNRQLRKAIKTKGHFPNEDAARKLIYLALQNAVPQWTRCRNWTIALLAFKIHFGDRYLTRQTDCHIFTTTGATVTINQEPPTQKTGRPRVWTRLRFCSVIATAQ
jgi:hypothetical protein